MKEEKTYICEYCGLQSKNYDAIRDCEAAHEIVVGEYRIVQIDGYLVGTEIPARVTVQHIKTGDCRIFCLEREDSDDQTTHKLI